MVLREIIYPVNIFNLDLIPTNFLNDDLQSNVLDVVQKHDYIKQIG